MPTEKIKRGITQKIAYDALRLFSALTHGIGAYISSVAAAVLISYAAFLKTSRHVVAFSIYSFMLIALYSTSTLYHSLPAKPEGRKVLRKLDHIMIYLFIAGTYTPICLITLRNYNPIWGYGILAAIWAIAVIGIIVKMIWIGAPRWLSTLFYVGMGWFALIAVLPLMRAASVTVLSLLGAGGFFYTTGAVLYALKWPGRYNPRFGFHEIFHLFCLAGSICHFVMMFFI